MEDKKEIGGTRIFDSLGYHFKQEELGLLVVQEIIVTYKQQGMMAIWKVRPPGHPFYIIGGKAKAFHVKK